MARGLAGRLLQWYTVHGRDLPWRRTRDPYRLWVAEVMLQQTQVGTVIPYYRRWLKRFPTLRALASAPSSAVLAAWEGLGYYSRARHLHCAAQKIVEEHGGRLPRTVDSLRRLPGIGRYTAAAIASIAFDVDAAVLDGNVKRVLARVFDVRDDVKTARGEKRLWELAERLAPRGRTGDYNQALMDLGATICTPRAPACAICPLRAMCAARKLGVQLERPVTRKRLPVPHHLLAAGVVRKAGRVLIVQRPPGQLLGGLWAFPAGRCAAGKSEAGCLRRILREQWGLQVRVDAQTQTLTHAFTHLHVTQRVFDCRWQSGRLRRRSSAEAKWVRLPELSAYPMGKIDRQIAARLQAEPVQ